MKWIVLKATCLVFYTLVWIEKLKVINGDGNNWNLALNDDINSEAARFAKSVEAIENRAQLSNRYNISDQCECLHSLNVHILKYCQ